MLPLEASKVRTVAPQHRGANTVCAQTSTRLTKRAYARKSCGSIFSSHRLRAAPVKSRFADVLLAAKVGQPLRR